MPANPFGSFTFAYKGNPLGRNPLGFYITLQNESLGHCLTTALTNPNPSEVATLLAYEELVGERGFEPPTPWSRTRWPKEASMTPSDPLQHGSPVFMRARRIVAALHVYPSDRERNLPRRVGMGGLRHKPRHKIPGVSQRAGRSP